jgi:hypothetical protein
VLVPTNFAPKITRNLAPMAAKHAISADNVPLKPRQYAPCVTVSTISTVVLLVAIGVALVYGFVSVKISMKYEVVLIGFVLDVGIYATVQVQIVCVLNEDGFLQISSVMKRKIKVLDQWHII